jgi:hypothetical protein
MWGRKINNPLQPKLAWVIFKNSVHTAKKTQHITVTEINWLTLFKEIITLQWESYETHKYKMQSYWLLKQVGHIVTTGL